MKAIILKVRNSSYGSNNRSNSNKSKNFSCKPVRPSSCNGKPFTKDNLHKLLNEILVETNDSENYAIISEDGDGSNDSTLLFNSKTVSNINPGDTRKNFHKDSPSEVTEELDCSTDTSPTASLPRMTKRNYDTYLPSELPSRPASFIIFTSCFAAENSAIEKVENHSNLVLSFIDSNSSIFETEELLLPDPLISDANVISLSCLIL